MTADTLPTEIISDYHCRFCHQMARQRDIGRAAVQTALAEMQSLPGPTEYTARRQTSRHDNGWNIFSIHTTDGQPVCHVNLHNNFGGQKVAEVYFPV